jgi:hypothetical protein
MPCRIKIQPLFQPLRIVERTVEVVSRFVKLILSPLGSFFSLREECGHLSLTQGMKGTSHLQGLLQNRKRVATCNDDAGWQIQGIPQAFYRFDRFALEDQAVSQGFMPSTPMLCSTSTGSTFFSKLS